MKMTFDAPNLSNREFRVLMEVAYESIIEDIHLRCQRVLRYIYGVKKIHSPFVPPNIWGFPIIMPDQEFYRHINRQTWTKRNELLEKEYKADLAKLQDLITIVEELERWFEIKKEESISASVNEFLGAVKKPPKRR